MSGLDHDQPMKDLAFGALVRMARVKRRWRQVDLADRAGVSRGTIGRVERGRSEEVNLATLRGVCAALGFSVELLPRGLGAELDRMVTARHSGLHEAVARWLGRAFPGWIAAPEVSFNIWGERGVIDLLLWHPGRRAVLIIEFKTELADLGALIASMDVRRRLAHEIAAKRGWSPLMVATWVIVGRSRTNERRVAAFRTMLRSAFPADGRRMVAWLRDPSGSIDGLSLWQRAEAQASNAPVQRVRHEQRARIS